MQMDTLALVLGAAPRYNIGLLKSIELALSLVEMYSWR